MKTVKWVSAAVGIAAASYAAYVAATWLRYGHAARHRSGEDADTLLDRFMPEYDVVERHHARVPAPADVTLAAAREMDLDQSAVIRAIFKGRELILGSHPPSAQWPRGVVAATLAMGWGVLAEIPGREIVIGVATKPWEADVVFRPLAPEEFRAFREPGYVKIAWTLRADPISATESIFRTETRSVATDADARDKFRWYWSFLSPGIILIRWMMDAPLRADAAQRVHRLATSRGGV